MEKLCKALGEVKSKANSYCLTNNGGLTTESALPARAPVLGGDPGGLPGGLVPSLRKWGATGGTAGDEAGWPVSCRNQLAATSPVLGSQAMAHHTRLYLPRALRMELNILLQARQALYQPSYPFSPNLYFLTSGENTISSGAEGALGCSLDFDGCVFVISHSPRLFP